MNVRLRVQTNESKILLLLLLLLGIIINNIVKFHQVNLVQICDKHFRNRRLLTWYTISGEIDPKII